MNPTAKKAIKFVVRWGIAVLGIGWVISNISLHDRVMIQNPTTGRTMSVQLAKPATEDARQFEIIVPDGRVHEVVQRGDLWVKSDRDSAVIREADGSEIKLEVLALKVQANDDNHEHWPLLVAKPRTFIQKYTGTNAGDVPRLVQPGEVVGGNSIRVPYPIIETGLAPMTAEAFRNKPFFLLLAVLVFPITFIITSFRWHMLLEVLEIRMSIGRTFVINMVGAFYNTFMPGSTGGDVLKAYYAAKQTQLHRTRAVMSVIVDRIIGLLALVILGGTMAAVQYFMSDKHDAVTRKCGQVALGSLGILGITFLGTAVFYLRNALGLERIICKLPMQKQVNSAIETMEIYRRHPLRILAATLMTLPVHGTVVLSAMFAGMAFKLPMEWWYYWVAVPVIVLSGSIPISPQGAGVMEFFAILLTRSQGVTVSQAFALTMSIRIVQILWNLSGGIFVLRGGYHAPTSAEQHELEEDGPGNSADRTGIEPA